MREAEAEMAGPEITRDGLLAVSALAPELEGPDARTAIRTWNEALYELHIVPAPYDDIDWPTMLPVADDLTIIERASLDEVRAMMTFISRAERFAGGWLDWAADTGVAAALSKRLGELADDA